MNARELYHLLFTEDYDGTHYYEGLLYCPFTTDLPPLQPASGWWEIHNYDDERTEWFLSPYRKGHYEIITWSNYKPITPKLRFCKPNDICLCWTDAYPYDSQELRNLYTDP